MIKTEETLKQDCFEVMS